ncbi:hypothetical protein ACUTQW_02940 [Serratia sp. TSA_7]|uniref:hypothetical protein n=1 Tax=Serratia TaxID=613 RepID=UPI0002A35378|nr:hypothetical protein [Serratia plymuthica]EKF64869.1 hypothetical protein B194_2089 [Serratia plymuthica A30]
MHAYELGRKLEALSEQARSNLSGVESTQAEVRRLQLVLKQQIAILYQQMASMLLKESPHISDMANVQTFLDKLQQEISQSRQAVQRGETEIESQRFELQGLHEEINLLENERNRQLQQSTDVQSAMQMMVKSGNDTDLQENHHNELMVETASKLTEYRQHPLFTFLLKKNYGQPDYVTWPLLRNLDSWLARHTNYLNNAANYRMLLALQEESSRRLLQSKTQAEQLTKKYQQHVQVVEDKLKLPQLYLKLSAAEKGLAAMQQKIRNQQNKLREYAQGEGETYTHIATQLSAQMALLPLDKLDLLVAKTATPDDDHLLEELRKLKREENLVEENRYQYDLEAKLAQKRVAAANELENQFSVQGYDNPIYEYQWGWSDKPEEIFENYLAGAISLKTVLHKLDMITRRLPPPPTPASASSGSWGNSYSRNRSSNGGFGSSSSSSSSSPSGGGGFSTSSSTGGSGFRTTDSF